MNIRLRSLCYIFLVFLLIPLCYSTTLRDAFPKSRSIIVHVKVEVPDVARAQGNINFPSIIPLLFGNSIISYSKLEDNSYHIYHAKSVFSNIHPMKTRKNARRIAGFKFKQYSFGAHPVPMENSVLFVRIEPYESYARLFIWIVSHGIYSQDEIIAQRLYTRSLANEFADNARRVLGVAACQNLITVSGLCNHRTNTLSGTTMQELLSPIVKMKRPKSLQMSSMKPNVRDVSDAIVKPTHNKKAPDNINLWFVIFGQFVDHEIVLTPGESSDVEALTPISVPNSEVKMDFKRAGVLRYDYQQCCDAQYKGSSRVWESPPFNRLTALIDGSAVYGSSHLRVNTLRAFQKGKLILQEVNNELHMPFNNPSQLKFRLHNEPSDHNRLLFAAGDVRANENVFLTAAHTLFAREHNRVCDLLHKHLRSRGKFRLLRDSWLFATARQIISAQMQSIIFHEFIPLLLGPKALPQYDGYKSNIDARISVLHSSFAFRWGHSGIAENFYIKDRDGNIHLKRLRDVFFTTKEFLNFGVDNTIEAAMNVSSMDIDEQIIESLRDFLFTPPESKLLDLAALNLQRGRDLGTASYLDAQKLMNTGTELKNIPKSLRKKLLAVYEKPENIDAFIGCLSERKVPGALLGPLCWKINQQQFLNLRDGDRFYYENVQWHKEIRNLDLIKKISNHEYRMADLVKDNTGLDSKLEENESLFKTTSLKTSKI